VASDTTHIPGSELERMPYTYPHLTLGERGVGV
jgi:hypothetical protein